MRKAVIPAAGLGTRFRPVTMAVPKPMLPVLDTPLIHYAAGEAAAAGVERAALVAAPGHDSIARYFESAAGDGADSGLPAVTTIEQREQRGLGHAVSLAREFAGGEPFAALLPDELFWGDRPALSYLLDAFDRFGECVLGVREVAEESVPSLGIIDPVRLEDGLYEVRGIVEKPRIEDAPSRLASVGRYVLTADVFDALDGLPPGAGGEIQLTDAIAALLGRRRVYAVEIPGHRVDAGTPVGLLRASVHEALRRSETAAAARRLLGEELGESRNL